MPIAETVFIVDDDANVRDALQKHLSPFTLQFFNNADDFHKAFQTEGPSCVLIELKLPGSDGLSILRKIFESGSQCPVIMMSASISIPKLTQAMKFGAWDFIEKPFNPEHIRLKVKACLKVDRLRVEQDSKFQLINSRLRLLTPRENEVLEYVIDGKPSKVIAEKLGISENTLETHRRNILSKMKASNAAALANMVSFVRTLAKQLEFRQLRLI